MASCDCEQVCTLPSDELEARIAMIRTEIAPHVLRTEALPNGRAFEFARSPGLQAKLEEWLALERQCCSELQWNLVAPDRPEVLRLTIEGIDPGSTFFAPFRAGGGLARAAKAGGIGVLGAFVVCCLLPGVVALVAGAAVAAPLAKLDQPIVLAAGAMGATAVAWLFLRRRARAWSA